MIDKEHIEKMGKSIKGHEGLRLMVYTDQVGVLTIGYGHNLEAKPISRRAAEVIFDDDLEEAMNDAQKIPEYHMVCSARRAVLTEMVFNLGLHGVMQFSKMRAAITAGKFDVAAAEMLDSKWAAQVGKRARNLADIMETGIYTPAE